ncbi:hypothetical protein GEMRC1_011570 [Eukaryota sp. GEM-RC1]
MPEYTKTNAQQLEELFQSFKPTGKEFDESVLGPDADLISSDSQLYRSDDTFEELGVPEDIRRAVYDDLRFTTPSEIQAESIPKVMDDPPSSCLVQSQSGTGKTLAFALSSLMRIDRTNLVPQVLVVGATREISRQIFSLFTTLVKHTEPAIKICPLLRGGRGDSDPNTENIVTSPSQAHVIIGTCGTIQQTLRKKELSLQTITVFVIDEADQLLQEDKSRDHIFQILKVLPDSCQRLLFSATFPEVHRTYYLEIAKKPAGRPKIIMKKEEELPLSCILQIALNTTSRDGRLGVLGKIMQDYFSIGQAIIFVSTRDQAGKLHAALTEGLGFECGLMTGQVENRDEVFDAFAENKIQILVSSDVLHRGIDVRHVVFVINYDLPFKRDGSVDFASYIHRIGRTGRFGRRGIAINFTYDEEGKSPSSTQAAILAIRNHYHKPLPWVSLDEPDQLKELVDKVSNEERLGSQQ